MKWNPHQRYDYPSGDHITSNTQQEFQRSHPTSSRQTGRGSCKPGEDEQEGNRVQTAVTNEQDTTEMQSQYQKDFPPPSSCRRRRTPAFPQPDNIGINPAFRWVCQHPSQPQLNVESSSSVSVCLWFTGSTLAQCKERITLAGPSWIPDLLGGWEWPRPDNQTWINKCQTTSL